jgi:UDP-N-acetylmuramate--alanine ligase
MSMKKPDCLKKIKQIHFTGIKGVGMAALACCAQDLKIKITGSDIGEIFITDELLKRRGIKWKTGFSPKNIKNSDLLITTGAHGGFENPEVKEAIEKGIKAVSQAEGLAMFTEGKEIISVCGVGGKTTTASMVAMVLNSLGLEPGFAIGVGRINSLGDPGRYGRGKYFVAEADEYAVSPGRDDRPRFIFQKPRIIVVTNLEHDHPDIYSNLGETKKVFKNFFKTLPQDGLLVACIDNKNIADLIQAGLGVSVQTYGFSPRADWQIEKAVFAPGKTFFNLTYQGIRFENIILSVPGKFNALNAVAAFAVANFLGGDNRRVINGLRQFRGSRRRFELIGEKNGIRLYDDYAHHPVQIRATLKAAKDWFPDSRLVVIFQPHTFTRTKAFFDQFAKAFFDADEVLISDIYASAREKPLPGINSKRLFSEVKKYKRSAFYCPGKEEVLAHLEDNLQGGEIIFTLGAGDIFLWHKEILQVIGNLS